MVVAFGGKVLRAVEHLKALEDSAQRFGKEKGNPGVLCVGEPNSQGTKYLLRVQGRIEFPETEWGIIIGDAVHCLRSALDQLVYGLCAEPSSATCFPICRKDRDWIVEAPRMYWSLPPAYVAVLDRAQPYHRGDAADKHPLAVLNALWNLDKHQAIPAVALMASKIRVCIVEQQGVILGEFQAKPGVALKHGAVIAESKLSTDGSGLKPKVNVNAHLTVGVGFGVIKRASSITGKPVAKTFHELLIPAVKGVLDDAMAAHVAST